MSDLQRKARAGRLEALRLTGQARANVFFDPALPRPEGGEHGVLATLVAIDALPRHEMREPLRLRG